MKIILLAAAAVTLAGGSCGLSESRGEPHRGQVTNSQWSQTYLTAVDGDDGVRLEPGESTPKGRKFERICVPAGFSGSARIVTDDNLAGFPPTIVHGGSCHDLKPRDIASVTVSR